MSKYNYGYKKDSYDHRDLYRSVAPHSTPLPTHVDLRTKASVPVFDQGQLGSCSANALSAAHLFAQLTESGSHPAVVPSRLDIYYRERVIEGTVHEDSGAMLRDGIKALAKNGVCPETVWPYDITKFTLAPPAVAVAQEAAHKITVYQRVLPTSLHVKQAIAAGDPVVIGIQVYASFESDHTIQTGIIPIPAKHEQLLGGHAVILVGYDDAHSWFILQNSWGTGVGVGGFFYLPYKYIDSGLGSDFWTITKTLR